MMGTPHRTSHASFDETAKFEFYEFLKTERGHGHRFSTSSKAATYVAQDKLHSFLDRPGNLQAVVEGVCQRHFTRADLQAVKKRLRFLAILVLIERGDLFTHCIKFAALVDIRLPLEAPPSFFSPETFRRFDEEQWAFCAYEFKNGPSDERILKDTIFPISRREVKGTGRTSTAWLVDIHPWYCFCGSGEDDEDTEVVSPSYITVLFSCLLLLLTSY